MAGIDRIPGSLNLYIGGFVLTRILVPKGSSVLRWCDAQEMPLLFYFPCIFLHNSPANHPTFLPPFPNRVF